MEFNTIEQALTAIRSGQIVVVVDDQGREHEGDLIAAAELVTPDIINFMVTHGKGLVCVPLGKSIIEKLQLPAMVSRNRDRMGTAFTVSVDHVDTTTGISAWERALSIKNLAMPESKPEEFQSPGHVFPLVAAEGGVLVRPGHTEAAVDLARLAGLRPAAAICEILKEDGTMARTEDLLLFAQSHGLMIITINQMIEWLQQGNEYVVRDSVVELPTEFGLFKSFTYFQYPSAKHHVALVMGDLEEMKSNQSVLVRLHSECLTGDVFHSLRCDCGEQLKRSMHMIAEEGRGVLIYLRQEGRGIGFPNKMRAYALQDAGHDTVDANIVLGFAPDERDYTVGAQILDDLGIRSIRLVTNNPDKISELESHGIKVEKRIPMIIPPNVSNERYLATKSKRMGHKLEEAM